MGSAAALLALALVPLVASPAAAGSTAAPHGPDGSGEPVDLAVVLPEGAMSASDGSAAARTLAEGEQAPSLEAGLSSLLSGPTDVLVMVGAFLIVLFALAIGFSKPSGSRRNGGGGVYGGYSGDSSDGGSGGDGGGGGFFGGDGGGGGGDGGGGGG